MQYEFQLHFQQNSNLNVGIKKYFSKLIKYHWGWKQNYCVKETGVFITYLWGDIFNPWIPPSHTDQIPHLSNFKSFLWFSLKPLSVNNNHQYIKLKSLLLNTNFLFIKIYMYIYLYTAYMYLFVKNNEKS